MKTVLITIAVVLTLVTTLVIFYASQPTPTGAAKSVDFAKPITDTYISIPQGN